LLLPTLASYYLHDRSLLMSRRNIIFYLFSLTYLVRWALNVRAPEISLACAALHGSRRRFHVNMGFSDDDRILAVTGCKYFIQYGYISILRNSIWPPSAILDLLVVVVGPPQRCTNDGYFRWKFCHDWHSSVEVISVWISCCSHLKVLLRRFSFLKLNFCHYL